MAHVLDFLRKALDDEAPRETPTAEYRLLCSGELFNEKVLTTNYTKTNGARFLMWGPFDLMVCSHRYDDYPQELALSIAVEQVQEGIGNSSMSHRPDDEIARDMAALLTVYARRLITVAGKVRTRWPEGIEGIEPRRDEWPEPIVGSLRAVAWPRRPGTVSHGPEGMRFRDYAPPARAVDPGSLLKFLRDMSSMAEAEAYVASARHYALALEQIESRPAAAYLLLISSIEALAAAAYRDVRPPEPERIEVKKDVCRLAVKMGLTEEQGRKLSLEASKDMSWSSWKFRTFIQEHVTADVWEKADDLFEVPPMYLPNPPKYPDFVHILHWSLRATAGTLSQQHAVRAGLDHRSRRDHRSQQPVRCGCGRTRDA